MNTQTVRRKDKATQHNTRPETTFPKKNLHTQVGLKPMPYDSRCDSLPTELLRQLSWLSSTVEPCLTDTPLQQTPRYNGQTCMSRLFYRRVPYVHNPSRTDTPLLIFRITDSKINPKCFFTKKKTRVQWTVCHTLYQRAHAHKQNTRK